MKKHLKYLSYVVRHKWFVLLAGLKTGAPIWRLIIHDWSKFLPSEWFPYVQYFYGDNKGEGLDAIGRFGLAELAPYGFYAEDRFNVAWLHHQKRNKHHWQYWMLQKDDGQYYPLPMPESYIKEMVADWAGAGRAITGKWEVADWFSKNKHKIVMRDLTSQYVIELIKKHF